MSKGEMSVMEKCLSAQFHVFATSGRYMSIRYTQGTENNNRVIIRLNPIFSTTYIAAHYSAFFILSGLLTSCQIYLKEIIC